MFLRNIRNVIPNYTDSHRTRPVIVIVNTVRTLNLTLIWLNIATDLKCYLTKLKDLDELNNLTVSLSKELFRRNMTIC
jgi:hypothetical protein